ncbi:MAG: ester cyclase [Thermoanaerobaculia bacterium]|nr:ester cyclase [Thermoanaerobaculia bacterium]
MRTIRILAIFTFVLVPVLSSLAATPNENRAIVEEFTETVYNQRQLDRIPDYVSAGFVDNSPGAPENAKGPEFVLEQAKQTFRTFTDLQFEILRTLAEDDLVSMHWRAVGTAASTGEITRVEGISIFRMDEGKIVESWDIVDRLSMLRQLGFRVVPPDQISE